MHTLKACSQSVGRTLSDGQNFPILLAKPTSNWGLICQYNVISRKIQHNSMLDFVLCSIPAENFYSIQHCENNFKNGTFFIKNEFYAAEFAPYHIFVKMMVK